VHNGEVEENERFCEQARETRTRINWQDKMYNWERMVQSEVKIVVVEERHARGTEGNVEKRGDWIIMRDGIYTGGGEEKGGNSLSEQVRQNRSHLSAHRAFIRLRIGSDLST
jgi:hypothetical protein